MLRWTNFLMIPVSTLFDEYIDRPKLTEQKNPFEYIVPPPPPHEGSEQLIVFELKFAANSCNKMFILCKHTIQLTSSKYHDMIFLRKFG